MFNFFRDQIESPIKNFLRQLQERSAKFRVTERFSIIDDGIERQLSNGVSERILGQDVTKISIVTTDQGPFVDDFFYLFQTTSSGMIVPIGWAEKIQLTAWLHQRFAGLNSEGIVAAAGSCVNAQFVLWEPNAAAVQQ
jgi:hypothetical protein